MKHKKNADTQIRSTFSPSPAATASSSSSFLLSSSANRFFSAFFNLIIVISSKLGLPLPVDPIFFPSGEPAAAVNDANEGCFRRPSAVIGGAEEGVERKLRESRKSLGVVGWVVREGVVIGVARKSGGLLAAQDTESKRAQPSPRWLGKSSTAA